MAVYTIGNFTDPNGSRNSLNDFLSQSNNRYFREGILDGMTIERLTDTSIRIRPGTLIFSRNQSVAFVVNGLGLRVFNNFIEAIIDSDTILTITGITSGVKIAIIATLDETTGNVTFSQVTGSGTSYPAIDNTSDPIIVLGVIEATGSVINQVDIKDDSSTVLDSTSVGAYSNLPVAPRAGFTTFERTRDIWTPINNFNFEVAGDKTWKYRVGALLSVDEVTVTGSPIATREYVSTQYVTITNVTTSSPATPGYTRVTVDNALPSGYDDTLSIKGISYSSNPLTGSGGGTTDVPTGTTVAYGGNSAPTGFLLCNGALISRTTYSDLFAIIGTSFGSGDGSTTFAVPDLRGRFIRGRDGGAGNDPDSLTRTASGTGGSTGDNVGSYQADEYKAHTHQVIDMRPFQFNGGVNDLDAGFRGFNELTSSSGGNETRPKNVYMNYIIKT